MFYYALLGVSIFCALIPLYCSVKNHKAFNIQLKALFIYLILGFTFEIIGLVLAFIYKTSNHLALNVFTLLETLFVIFIYQKEFNQSKYRNFFLILYLFFLTVFSLNFSSFDNGILINVLESSVLIILPIIYFVKIFVDMTIPKLTNYYFFWLNSAFLIYFSSSFCILLCKNYIQLLSIELVQLLWSVHLLNNIIYNIILSIGICKVKQT